MFVPDLEDYYTSDYFYSPQSRSSDGSECPETMSGRGQSFFSRGTLVLSSVVVAAILLGIALG